MDKSEDYLALVINKISEWANIKTETDKQDLTNNIFKILGVEDFEIRHSNFLAWLFNKNENPIAKEFTTKFLKLLNLKNDFINTLVKSDYVVEREFGEDLDGKRIDLMLKFDELKTIFVLENKVYSTEGDNQLEFYRCKIDGNFPEYNKYYIYLTLNGDKPENEIEANFWICITYLDVLDVLKSINLKGLENKLKNYVKDYISVLENKTERVMNRKKEFWNLYKQSKEIREIMNEIADFVPQYTERLEKFKKCVEEINELNITISGNSSFPELDILELQNLLTDKGVDKNFVNYNLTNSGGSGVCVLQFCMNETSKNKSYAGKFYEAFRAKFYKETKYTESKNGIKLLFSHSLGVNEDAGTELQKQEMLCNNLKSYFVDNAKGKTHYEQVFEFIENYNFNIN